MKLYSYPSNYSTNNSTIKKIKPSNNKQKGGKKFLNHWQRKPEE